jgi:hypothetical protein
LTFNLNFLFFVFPHSTAKRNKHLRENVFRERRHHHHFLSFPPTEKRSRQRRHGVVLLSAQRSAVATETGVGRGEDGIGTSKEGVRRGTGWGEEEEDEAEGMVLGRNREK